MMTSPTCVLITDGLGKAGLEKLSQNPSHTTLEILFHKELSLEMTKETLPEADILVVRSRTKVNSELLKHAKKLKLIVRAGIGLDNIDVTSATKMGIVVKNTPSGNIISTAEHTIALLFSLSRNIPSADASIRSGKWEKSLFEGVEVFNKTLGIIGYGNIGKVVAQKASALGLNVLVFDPYISPSSVMGSQLNIRFVDLDSLLHESDYVSLHVPLSPETHHLINQTRLMQMKKGSFLIQCARGGLVDEMALLNALKSGHLAGAALDVFEKEPPQKDHPLFDLPQVVMTPHIGASTKEAQAKVSLEVVEHIFHFLKTQPNESMPQKIKA